MSQSTQCDTLRLPLARLPDPLHIPTPERGARPFDISMTPPGSKSLTNRALLLAALAGGRSTLRGALLDADDSMAMLSALGALRAPVEIDVAAGEVRIEGLGGALRAGEEGCHLNARGAGTAMRFLAAASLLADGPVTLDGDARMRQRPIDGLARALTQLGAGVEFLDEDGFPPLRITPTAQSRRGGEVRLKSTPSSQFLSALLLVGPWLERGVSVTLENAPPSAPYIRMTLAMLRRLGAACEASDDLRSLRVAPGPLAPFTMDIEPDASGASYFWGAAALIADARAEVVGLTRDSLQGDIAFIDTLAQMGAAVEESEAGLCVRGGTLRGIECNCVDIPDAAMTLVVAACFAGGESLVRGLRTLRVKETDRLAALQRELTKIGARVEIVREQGDEALRIIPPSGGVDDSSGAPPVEFDTYTDHRMAMSLALVGLRRPNTFVRDPGCVRKTWPGFWGAFAGLFS